MRKFVTSLSILVLICITTFNSPLFASQWSDIEEKARGQVVYFNGWGGADPINDYIRWAATEIKERYQITVKHVKVTDIGEVVSRILAEKNSGRTSGGSVDLMWINGENFNTMKKNGLLSQPYAHLLPNAQFVDTENKRSTLYDFTVPVDNMEIPWGMAQLVFLYDTARVENPPKNMHDFLLFAKKYPGRTTYPLPPNFHGTTFLKQALIELTVDKNALSKPADQADVTLVTAPLWQFLDELHPYLWRKGKSFPANSSEMKQLLNDSELLLALSFNPAEASNAIATGELPDTIRTYVHDNGTIGNTHFVAIPFNASSKEGALVFANFLLSPEAQARKSDPSIWGDPTVLSLFKLDAAQKKYFSEIPTGIATLGPEQLGTVLLEPHASWVTAIEKAWLERYSR